MSVGAINNSSISQQVSRPAAESSSSSAPERSFFNVFKSQDKDGTLFAELFISRNGHIESGKVDQDSLVNVFLNEDPFVMGQMSNDVPAGVRNAFQAQTGGFSSLA